MNNLLRFSPPTLYKVSILIMIFIGVLPVKSFITFPWNLSGLLILITGILIAVNAKKIFKKNNTPISPEASPKHLHIKGVFRFSRNPMYLGIIIGLLGIAVVTGKLINIVFPIIYFIVMDRVFVKLEELNLEKEFGEQFISYKRKTRKWL